MPPAQADRATALRSRPSPAATLPPVQRINHQSSFYWWLGLLLVAGFFSTQGTFHFAPADSPLPSPTEREEEAFLALVFGKISDADTETGISTPTLRSHLRALKEAGYTTVRLADVARFVRDGTPLPRHPVLLTFDQARSESLENADPILESLEMNAVAFANVQALSEANLELVSVHRLAQMVRSGRWEAGVSGCAGEAPASEAGPTFTADGFRRQRDLLGGWLRRQVLAIDCQRAWPDEQSSLASWTESLNGASYRLGFVVAAPAANYRDQPALELRRLRVQKNWRGADLLSRLEEYAPRRSPYADDFSSPGSATPWIADHGEVTAEHGVLKIQAKAGDQGALAVLAGSERWRDAEVKIRARSHPQGQFWVYLRRGSARSFVRIGIVGRVALLQQAGADGATHQVGSRQLDGEEATLVLRVAGSRAVATVDGRALVDRPAEVDGKLKRGPVALAVWDPDAQASAEILSLEARPLSPHAAVFPASPSGKMWEQIRKGSEELTVLSPEYFAWQDGKATEIDERDSLVPVFARYHRLALLPAVTVEGQVPEGHYFPFALQIVRWASDPRIDGLNLIVEPASPDSSWPSLISELRKRLRALGKELIVTTVNPATDPDDGAREDATFHLPTRELETLQVAEAGLTFVDASP